MAKRKAQAPLVSSWGTPQMTRALRPRLGACWLCGHPASARTFDSLAAAWGDHRAVCRGPRVGWLDAFVSWFWRVRP